LTNLPNRYRPLLCGKVAVPLGWPCVQGGPAASDHSDWLC